MSTGLPTRKHTRRFSLLKPLRLLSALVFFGGLSAALCGLGWLPAPLARLLASLQYGWKTAATDALHPWLPALFLFPALLLLALLAGRVFCSAMCPLGIWQDIVRRAAMLLKRRRKTPGGGLSPEWRRARLAVLCAVVFSMAAGWGAWAMSVLSPFSLFGRAMSALGRPAAGVANNLVARIGEARGWWSIYTREGVPAELWVAAVAALTVLVISLMAFRRGRLWCNTLCPVGTLLGCVSRRAALRLSINTANCVNCGDCALSCKAGCIDLRRHTVDASRCVACYDCLQACEHNAIRLGWAWRRQAAAPPAGGISQQPRRQFLQTTAALAASAATGLAAGKLLAPPAAAADAPAGGVCPPGAGSLRRFLDICTGCSLCVSECPGKVLQISLFAYGSPRGMLKPRLDFASGFCTYDCVRCGEVCPTGAIRKLPLEDKKLAQVGIAHFARERCVVVTNGSECGACGEHCPTRAIEMALYSPRKGLVLSIPKIAPELCIGCGGCEYVCPVTPDKAIQVRPLAVHGRAEPFREKPLAPKGDAGFAF
jgi:ferredoxin